MAAQMMSNRSRYIFRGKGSEYAGRAGALSSIEEAFCEWVAMLREEDFDVVLMELERVRDGAEARVDWSVVLSLWSRL